MIRYAVIAVAMIISDGKVFGKAQACSCGPCDKVGSFLDEPRYSFIGGGRVMAVALSEDGYDLTVTLKPIEVVRGSTSDLFTFKTPAHPASCGVTFLVGTTVRVATYEMEGNPWVYSCSHRCWNSEPNTALFTTRFDDAQSGPHDLCGRPLADAITPGD